MLLLISCASGLELDDDAIAPVTTGEMELPPSPRVNNQRYPTKSHRDHGGLRGTVKGLRAKALATRLFPMVLDDEMTSFSMTASMMMVTAIIMVFGDEDKFYNCGW